MGLVTGPKPLVDAINMHVSHAVAERFCPLNCVSRLDKFGKLATFVNNAGHCVRVTV